MGQETVLPAVTSPFAKIVAAIPTEAYVHFDSFILQFAFSNHSKRYAYSLL
jgi:hypothetical protein